MLPTLAVVKTFSSRTHPVRALSTPSVRKSDAPPVTPDNSRMSAAILAIRMCRLPFVCEVATHHTRKSLPALVLPSGRTVSQRANLAFIQSRT